MPFVYQVVGADEIEAVAVAFLLEHAVVALVHIKFPEIGVPEV